MRLTRKNLLENFDEEVHEKLRINLQESREYLSKYENWLWELTKFYLEPYADFADNGHSFTLRQNPFPGEVIYPGPYRIGKNVEDANIYRFGHPLAQRIIEKCKSPALDRQELVFDFSGTQKKISILEPLIGKTGWLSVCDLTIESFEVENDILFSGITDDGMALDVEQCQRFFSLPATIKPNQGEVSGDVMRTLELIAGKQREDILQRNANRNAGFFDSEMEKLDKWAEDVKNSLEIELKELDKEIKTRKTEARKILKLEEKVAAQREIKSMENKRNTLRQNLYQAQDEVDKRKDNLIVEIEARLRQKMEKNEIFTIRWSII